MEQPFEITYNSDNTTFVLAAYRLHDEKGQNSIYTIVIDEVSLGDLVKVNDSWEWKTGGKEGLNHGGVTLHAGSASEIGSSIDDYLATSNKSSNGDI